MGSLDTVSIAILLGSLLVLAGILSSLIALRFGAPLLLVFLLVGMLAGEGGPGGIKFDDVSTAYTVGSIALALILFDGGLRTRFASFRNVLAPSVMLATVGVLITTLLTAPVAKFVLGIGWMQALLVGAVVASTDAAAVFFLINARGLRLRPRVARCSRSSPAPTIPSRCSSRCCWSRSCCSATRAGRMHSSPSCATPCLAASSALSAGSIITLVLNRLTLAQGLHAPFVAVSALVVFAFANAVHASGFLAVYLAGLVVGNRADARAQFGRRLPRCHHLAGADRDVRAARPAGLAAAARRQPVRARSSVALVLMLIARPVAVFLCLAPFKFQWREKLFISWVGLRGAVGIFLASIPLLVGLPAAYLYFDVAFVVVLSSLLVQGWTVALAARKLDISFARADPLPRRVELDLPGQLAREIVGYPVPANSPFLRRGLIPNWARPTLVVRNEEILTPAGGAAGARGRLRLSAGAAGKGAGARPLLRQHAAAGAPDPRLLGDFFVPATATLGALAEIYGLQVAADHTDVTLADYFSEQLRRRTKTGDVVELGPIALLAHKVSGGRVTTVGLRLAEPEEAADLVGRLKILVAQDSENAGLERAPRQHRRMLHQPGAAEEHRGPEQIAEHGLVQERQRRDVALHQTLPACADRDCRRPTRRSSWSRRRSASRTASPRSPGALPASAAPTCRRKPAK